MVLKRLINFIAMVRAMFLQNMVENLSLPLYRNRAVVNRVIANVTLRPNRWFESAFILRKEIRQSTKL